MESYLIRPHKRTNGSCPYCEGNKLDNFTFVKNTKSNNIIEKHEICDKYSMLGLNSGVRYPLQNPLDSDSSSYM